MGDKLYCDNCGAKTDGRKKFCDNCGAAMRKVKPKDFLDVSLDEDDPYQPTPPALPRKILSLAVLLTIIFPGTGHFYVDKLGRALLYALGFTALLFVPLGLTISEVNPVVTSILFSLVGILWIWINIDTVILVRRYNKFVQKKLRKPRKSDKW